MNAQLYPEPNNNTQIVMGMISEIENWPHAALQNRIKQNLRKMFQSYHTLKTSQRSRLDQLIIQHKDFCLREGNETITRRHNTFVFHYISGISCKNIASFQEMHYRTVNKDLDYVLDRMMIFLFGFYGIRWDKNSPV